MMIPGWKIILSNYIGHLNDSITRDDVKLRIKRSCYNNKIEFDDVICDSSNNPPESIDNHELHVDIVINPEYIINLSVGPDSNIIIKENKND